MGMTEKQGGSDVRANVTDGDADLGRRRVHPRRAQVVHLRPDERRLPGAGAGRRRALLLPGARGCSPTAAATGWTSYASRTSWATGRTRPPSWSSAAPGRSGSATRAAGVRTIIEMVAATRLDCVLGSASLMRRALAEASWHVAHRSAFGGLLADKPLMQNVDRRPGGRVRGGHRAGDAAGRGGRRRRTTRTRRRCAGSRCRWRSSGSASAPR